MEKLKVNKRPKYAVKLAKYDARVRLDKFRIFKDSIELIKMSEAYIKRKRPTTPKHYLNVYLRVPSDTYHNWKNKPEGSFHRQWHYVISVYIDIILGKIENKLSIDSRNQKGLAFILQAYDPKFRLNHREVIEEKPPLNIVFENNSNLKLLGSIKDATKKL